MAAEVADFHLSLHAFEEEEDEPESEHLESISYWPYEFEHEEIYSSESEPDPNPDPFFFGNEDEEEEEEQRICMGCFESDSDSVPELHDFLRQDHHDDHEVNLNPNPIENRNSQDSPFFRVVDENHGMGSNNFLDLGLDRIDDENTNNGFMSDDDVSGDFFFGRSEFGGQSSDIPTFGQIGSISDGEVDEGFDFDLGGRGEVQDELDVPLCWDRLQLEDDDPGEQIDLLEWEEVVNRVEVEDRDGLSVMMDFEERSVEASIDIQVLQGREDTLRNLEWDFEERSVSASVDIQEVIDGREETMRNLEWEVLLQFNGMERNADLEHDLDHEDYIYPAEYEMVFGQFVENENAIRGSPPTAKSVIENLPSIVLTQEVIQNKGDLCAVCKDGISTEEQAKLLPCSHYYHGDCILPWLNIRNTCPVCRFELPTDDPDYEQRRTQRTGRNTSGVSQVRMQDFQMFPEN